MGPVFCLSAHPSSLRKVGLPLPSAYYTSLHSLAAPAELGTKIQCCPGQSIPCFLWHSSHPHIHLIITFPPHPRVTRGEACTRLRSPGQPPAPAHLALLPLLVPTRRRQDDTQILRRRSPQVRFSLGLVYIISFIFFLHINGGSVVQW